MIRRSRFFSNGGGDGYTHNLYVGAVRSLTVTGSHLSGADVGHELKSRAATNTIVGNRITDGDATASYSIDLPNGGDSLVAGNVIIQGPNSENPALVSYGAEGLTGGSRGCGSSTTPSSTGVPPARSSRSPTAPRQAPQQPARRTGGPDQPRPGSRARPTAGWG